MVPLQRTQKRAIIPALISITILLIVAFSLTRNGQASTLDELRQEIEKRNEEIKKLEEEAEEFRREVEEHQERGKTLAAEVARLNRNITQIQREINLTEQKIGRLALEIEALGLEIREKEFSIRKFRAGLGTLVQAFFEKEKESPLAILLKYAALSEFLRQIDYFALLQDQILSSLETIKELKKELEIKKADAEKKKVEQEELKSILAGRRSALSEEKQERSYLLQITRNQEKRYQQLLRDREAKIAALSDEIRKIEEKIRITIDPTSLPPKGTGALGWPLPEIELASCWQGKEPAKNCITQFFGYTQFASVGGYGGKGHNGVDFRASFGTPVLAAESGVVQGVGDTDIGCRGASYGKWILIRHPNNLSTLYAHLSEISVSPRQEIKRGERIGFSGSSGFATGPHLHFTVFAAQAVEITSIRSRVCGRLMNLPLAPINGYLNPLDYL